MLNDPRLRRQQASEPGLNLRRPGPGSPRPGHRACGAVGVGTLGLRCCPSPEFLTRRGRVHRRSGGSC